MTRISLAAQIHADTHSIMDACNSGRLSEGRFVSALESEVRNLAGAKHAIATSSGSSADLVCMLCMKQLHPEKDEVIVPALTFIAQVNSIIMAGLKPVFVDCYPDTMQMRLDSLENLVNERTLCIFGVHLLGRFSPVFDHDFGVPLIEDACEGLGGEKDGVSFGRYGLFGTFSFYPSHAVGCGEGGMIVTNSLEFANLARAVKNHGRIRHDPLSRFAFDVQGTNAKMAELSAAAVWSSISKVPEIVERRKWNVNHYNSLLGQEWFAESPHAYPVWCESREQRGHVLLTLESHGVDARCMFRCIPTDDWCKTHERGAFPHSEAIADRVLYVPVHQDLTVSNIEAICAIIQSVK